MWIVDKIKLRKKLLKVSPLALHDYRTKVKGNQHMPKLEVRKKLTRNVQLADLIGENDGVKFYQYGNLKIAVDDKLVIFIQNYKGKLRHFKKDTKRYYELNQELQIKE